MSFGLPASAALAVALLAGCLEPLDGPTDRDPNDAPQWKAGDWWTYRFTSEIYRIDEKVTLVVGRVEADGFLVGMPSDRYALNAILFHIPPVGRLTRNLSYNVHDVLYMPLQFPLHPGDVWRTKWIAAPVTFQASATTLQVGSESLPGFHVSNRRYEKESNRTYEFDYAPAVGWFTMYQRVDLDGHVRERIELVDHGSGFSGGVRLLDGIGMVFLESRTAPTVQSATTPPIATFTPNAKHPTIFAACVYGDAPGHYEIEIRSPSRSVCQGAGTLEASDVVRRITMRETPNEGGLWSVRFAATGAGVSVAEVMGYETASIRLSGN